MKLDIKNSTTGRKQINWWKIMYYSVIWRSEKTNSYIYVTETTCNISVIFVSSNEIPYISGHVASA